MLLSGVAMFSGCSNAPYIMTVGGEQIRPGIFIMNQYAALGEARGKLAEMYADDEDFDMNVDGFDFEGYQIEDVPFFDWVNNRAFEMTARMLVVDRMFDELDLSFTREYLAAMNAQIADSWSEDTNWGQVRQWMEQLGEMALQFMSGVSWGDFFTEAGVSFESFRFVMQNDDKEAMIFNSIYGEDGTDPVPDEIWQAQWEETRLRFRWLDIRIESEEPEDEDDAPFCDEELARIRELNRENREFMELLVDWYNNPPEGTVVSFTDLRQRYGAYVSECDECEEFTRHCECPCDECDKFPCECCEDCKKFPCECCEDGDCDDCDGCDAAAAAEPVEICSDGECERCEECLDCDDCGDCAVCDMCGGCGDCFACNLVRETDEQRDMFLRIPEIEEGEEPDEMESVLLHIANNMTEFNVAEMHESESVYSVLIRLDPLGRPDLRSEHRTQVVIELKAEGFTDRLEEMALEFLARDDVVRNDSVLAKHDPRWFTQDRSDGD
jgi:hypothetical protein